MPQSRKKIFSKIYDQYVDKIYRFVFFKVNSREVAEDITSKVFVRGWDRFKHQGQNSDTQPKSEIKNPGAYIYQVARAEIANYYREKSKFKIISAESAVIADPKPGLEEKSGLDSDIVAVRNCLASLSTDYQDVLIWRYINGYSTGKIAELMGKSKGAVRVMLHRALKELRGMMKKEK